MRNNISLRAYTKKGFAAAKSRAYRDDEGDPVLAMDIDLDFGGLPRENVGELFNTWTGLMSSYRAFVRGE